MVGDSEPESKKLYSQLERGGGITLNSVGAFDCSQATICIAFTPGFSRPFFGQLSEIVGRLAGLFVDVVDIGLEGHCHFVLSRMPVREKSGNPAKGVGGSKVVGPIYICAMFV